MTEMTKAEDNVARKYVCKSKLVFLKHFKEYEKEDFERVLNELKQTLDHYIKNDVIRYDRNAGIMNVSGGEPIMENDHLIYGAITRTGYVACAEIGGEKLVLSHCMHDDFYKFGLEVLALKTGGESNGIDGGILMPKWDIALIRHGQKGPGYVQEGLVDSLTIAANESF